MGLFRRQESARRRSPEERAHARAVREARRRGLPEPPPPPPDAEVDPFAVEPIAARATEQTPVGASGAPSAWPPGAEIVEDDPSPPQGDPLTPTPSEPPEPDESPRPDGPDRPHGDPAEDDAAAARGRGGPLSRFRAGGRSDEGAVGDDHAARAASASAEALRPAAAGDEGARADRFAPASAEARTSGRDAAPPPAEDAVRAARSGSVLAEARAPADPLPARPTGASAEAGSSARPAPAPAGRRGLIARLRGGGEERSARRALGRELPPLPAATAARQPPEPPPRPRSGPPTPPSRGPEPRRRPRRWGRRLVALVALVIVGAAVAFLIALFQPFHGNGHGVVRLTIPRGATARQIGDLLAKRGVVADGRLFSLRAALSGKRGDFNSGGFTLRHDMSYADAIAVLTTNPGTAPTINVTIPEGRSRGETAPLVRQAGITGDYLAATGHPPPRDLGAPRGARTLEGFLFPATYNLSRGNATAQALVNQQLAAFRRNFAKVDMRVPKRDNLTRYDVLTIASMIEREAQIPRERRLIAAVIYNRLRDGIPLGIDATIRYATGNWTRPLRESQLTSDSPYNLRKHTGLPPTPIGNPGLASLQAAAVPAHVPYLYYVVKPGTCGHAFSSTAARFQRDVRRYNQARARNGGNSPTKC